MSGEPVDIYTGRPVTDLFSIDHFLPWRFVAHELMRNLTPVDAATNPSRSDAVPDLGLFLPRLADLQFVVQALQGR